MDVGFSSSLDQSIQRIQDANTVTELREALATEILGYGFNRYAYLGITLPISLSRPVSLNTYPTEWRRRYLEAGYLDVDPVVKQATAKITPVLWGSRVNATFDKPSRDGRRFLNEASEHGIRGGITVPIHGRGLEFGTLTITCDEGETGLTELWKHFRHNLHILGLYFHEAVVDRLMKENPRRIVRLTRREYDCLAWTSRGKSAWEISEILGISETTVIFHLKNAMTKFGVYSRHHAVVKAIATGLIVP